MNTTLHTQLETRSIDTLIPYARNSRTHSDEQVAQVAASIKEFGFTNPVLIDETGGIIAGHGRVLAARKLGLPGVPCLTLHGLTEAQKRAYVIADNKLALNAGWDEDMLALEIKDLQSMDYDLDLLGFNTDDLDELLALGEATPEGETEADAVPEVQAEVVTQPGDVWVLGKHRVMCGDSTSADHVATLLGGACRILWLLIRRMASSTTQTGATTRYAQMSLLPAGGPSARSKTTTRPTGARRGRCSLARWHTFGTLTRRRTSSQIA
jgi:hypothetical protein